MTDRPHPAGRLDPADPQAAPISAHRAARPVWDRPLRRRPRLGTVLVAIVGIVLVALAVMWVLQYLVGVLGVAGVVVNAVFALVPLLAVLLVVRWVDRWEPEPVPARIFAFLWGAGVSVGAALVVDETLNDYALRLGINRDQFFAIAVQSPVVEEGAKALGVLLLYLVLRRTFDGPVDGVVYAATVAAGFAFVENIQYFGLAFREGGESRLAYTFYVRGVLSPFAHLAFTSCTGIALGYAARMRRPAATVGLFAAGLAAAMVLHAGFNVGTALGDTGAFFFYAIVELPVFALMVGFVLFARRRDAALTYAALTQYGQAGWFTPAEVDMLGTAAGRRQARRWARSRGGAAGRAMSRFIRDATRLAYARQRILSDHGRGRAQSDEFQLLQAVTADREALLRG